MIEGDVKKLVYYDVLGWYTCMIDSVVETSPYT